MHAEDLPNLNCRIKIDNFYVDLSEKIYIKPSLRQKTPIRFSYLKFDKITQKQPPEVFYKKVFLKNFTKFTHKKTPVPDSLFYQS